MTNDDPQFPRSYKRLHGAPYDDDLAMWTNGYWEGAGFHPDSDRGEGPWKIAWVGTE